VPVKMIDHRVVYKDPQYYCGPGPAVVADEAGGLVVAFRRVPSWLEYGHAGHWHPATESCLIRSSDQGLSWSSPQVFLGGYQCPNLTRLGDGTLVHSTHRKELVPAAIAAGCPPGRGVGDRPWHGVQRGTAVWRSEDEGATWGDPVYLDGVPGIEPLHPNLHAPVAVRGNVLETAGGDLLITAYSIEDLNKVYLFRSVDAGRTWSWQSHVAEDFNETFLYETERGELVAFMRRWSGDDPRLFRTRSADGGDSWSKPEPLCKGYPSCAVRLSSGRVLLAYGYRFDDSFGVRARLLSADCELIDPDDECIIRDDGAVVDVGYPEVCLLPDGRAFVVYYINRREDAADSTAPRYIEACLIAEE